MIAKTFFAVSFVLFAYALGGCSSTQTQPGAAVVTVHPPINVNAVLIVPERVLDACDPLGVPSGGDRAAVLDTMIANHGIHGACSFKNDLKGDFIRAASDSQAKVQVYAPPN